MGEHHGTVWWNELTTRDVKAAKDYYATVCGWSFDEVPMDGRTYNVAAVGDRVIAGILDMAGMPGMQDVPPHWMTYLAVDDVDRSVEQTNAYGGTIIRPPWDVEAVGRIAIGKDPSGAVVGVMTPSGPPTP